MKIKHFVASGEVGDADFGKSGELAARGVIKAALIRVGGRAAGIDAVRFADGVHGLDGKMQELHRVGVRWVLPIIPTGRWFVLGRDGATDPVVSSIQDVGNRTCVQLDMKTIKGGSSN